jgi:hypothetical protein
VKCRRGYPLSGGDRILVAMVVTDVYAERRGDGDHTVVRARVARGRAEERGVNGDDGHLLADGDAVVRANPGDNIIDLFEDEPVTNATETI